MAKNSVGRTGVVKDIEIMKLKRNCQFLNGFK